ncbi:MAG: MFS transporter [Ectothiorhodospiraceae bacterium]
MSPAIPYWRLAGFYFFFFAIVGGLAPYWGPYLRYRGFDAVAIGELIAILHATKIIAPNLWGWIADHTGRRLSIIRFAALVAMVAFSGVFVGGGFWWFAVLIAVFSFFWNAALPQFEANTFNHLGAAAHRYSRIRAWGSVGFMVSVVAIGEATERLGLSALPVLVLGLFAGLWFMSLLAPQASQTGHDTGHETFLRVLARPGVMGFFIACFLLQASHGPFYAFYSIYLEDHGYSGGMIGILWAVGVAAEIAVFLVAHRWLFRFDARRLFVAALSLAVVRWYLVGSFPSLLAVQFLAQTLHAATFGVYHAVAISLVNRFFTGRNQGRGQAFYSSMTFGAGVATGSLAAGRLWATAGGAGTFFVAAAVAAAGTVVAYRSVPAQRIGR